MNSETLVAAKKDLRAVMQARRNAAYKANPDAAQQVHDIVLSTVPLPPHSAIAGFWNIGSELSPRPLMDTLRQQGHTILLPVMIGKTEPLVFRAYETDQGLVPGWQGIQEPPATAAVHEPDILLVPLLAFDRTLYRLGYGGGYYDRTLAELRERKVITAVGIGFACQYVATLPVGLHDARLDAVATETGFHR